MKSSKACKREIKSVMNTAGNVSLLVSSNVKGRGCSMPYAIGIWCNLKFVSNISLGAAVHWKLTLLPRFLVLCHQSAPSLFLKSNFEYLRGNYRKAVKLLNSSNIAEHAGPIKTGNGCSQDHLASCYNPAVYFVVLRFCCLIAFPDVDVITGVTGFHDLLIACVLFSFRWMCSMYVLEQPGLHSFCNGETQSRHFLFQEGSAREWPHLCTAGRW